MYGFGVVMPLVLNLRALAWEICTLVLKMQIHLLGTCFITVYLSCCAIWQRLLDISCMKLIIKCQNGHIIRVDTRHAYENPVHLQIEEH